MENDEEPSDILASLAAYAQPVEIVRRLPSLPDDDESVWPKGVARFRIRLPSAPAAPGTRAHVLIIRRKSKNPQTRTDILILRQSTAERLVLRSEGNTLHVHKTLHAARFIFTRNPDREAQMPYLVDLTLKHGCQKWGTVRLGVPAESYDREPDRYDDYLATAEAARTRLHWFRHKYNRLKYWMQKATCII